MRSRASSGAFVKDIETVSAARISWMVVVGVCAIGVIALAWNGYTGYAITAGAVGAAAGVNLL
jgi:hypothetical protein